MSELDVEVVLTRVIEAARELTGARYAAVGVLDPARGDLGRFVTVGIDEDARRRIGALPTGRGVLGELFTHPQPLRLADVGNHPHSYGFPINHPAMTSFLGVPVLVDGQPYGNLYLTDKQDGIEFTAEDEEAVMQLAELAGVAIDHARRYAGVEQQRQTLQRTVQALRATTDITRAVAGEPELQPILKMIAKRGRALVSARLLLIELVDNRELVVAAAAGELPADFLGRRIEIENTVAGEAMRTRQSQRLSDELNWNRFRQHGAGQFGADAKDGLVVPMIFRGEIEGVLLALDQEQGGGFDGEHQRLLESFAASAAMAVGTAQSAADERRRQSIAATEAERGRWARELHDETLQALAGVRLGLASARQANRPELMARAVDEAIEQLQSDMDTLRSLIADLRPGSLDELGVGAAILDLTQRFARTGIEIDANVELAFEDRRDAGRLVPELETAIYRTIQEALNNVTKHSGANRVVVEVIEVKDAISVTIRDSGSGFDAGSRTDGFGLAGMRERVGLAGGRLTITSEAGKGATVSAEFPVRRREPGDLGLARTV